MNSNNPRPLATKSRIATASDKNHLPNNASTWLPVLLGLILAATWMGHRLAGCLSQERFRDVVSAMLVIAGGTNVVRCVLL